MQPRPYISITDSWNSCRSSFIEIRPNQVFGHGTKTCFVFLLGFEVRPFCGLQNLSPEVLVSQVCCSEVECILKISVEVLILFPSQPFTVEAEAKIVNSQAGLLRSAAVLHSRCVVTSKVDVQLLDHECAFLAY